MASREKTCGSLFFLFSVFCSLLCSSLASTSIYVGELTGAGENPAVNTTDKGLAIVYYQNTTGQFNYTIAHNITTPVFSQIIYTNSTPPVQTTLVPIITVTSPIIGMTNLSSVQQTVLQNNSFSVNLYTYTHITGDIKGTLRTNKFNGSAEFAGIVKNSTENETTPYLGVSYLVYNCSIKQARIRLVHNLNQSIEIELLGIRNSSFKTSTQKSSNAPKAEKLKPHKLSPRPVTSPSSSTPSPSPSPSPSPYISIFNLSASASQNVVNVTVNITHVNFTDFFGKGAVLLLNVSTNSTNTTTIVLTGFLNQTDKETCFPTIYGPLDAAQNAAIGVCIGIVGLLLIAGFFVKFFWKKKPQDVLPNFLRKTRK